MRAGVLSRLNLIALAIKLEKTRRSNLGRRQPPQILLDRRERVFARLRGQSLDHFLH
jgi:hypothetical protein